MRAGSRRGRGFAHSGCLGYKRRGRLVPGGGNRMAKAMESGEDGGDTRLLKRAAGWGLACLFAAGGLLWFRFGDAVFLDSLAFLRSCF